MTDLSLHDTRFAPPLGQTGEDMVGRTAAGTEVPSTLADLPLQPHRLSVVVPMYNEIANAAPLIDAVQAALTDYPQPWELIVVDDGSRDGTGPALQRRAAEVGAHVHIVRLARNFRQTAAMQAGIDAARGDVIVTLDGDLQNDPRDIPALVAQLLSQDLDIVAGWRIERQDGFWLRRLPSQLANRLIRRITQLPFHDLGCSLKAFRADVLREVRLYGEMHRFIPAWLSTVTTPDRMGERPVRHHARSAGQSKYGLSRTLRVVVDLLAVSFFQRYAARPGHFFGVIGLLLTLASLGVLGYLGVLKLLGESVGSRPLLALGFSGLLGGLQFLTTGVLAELLIRIYYGARHAAPYVVRSTGPLVGGSAADLPATPAASSAPDAADAHGWGGPAVSRP